MRIGALASQTRTTVETIRYYEREGLLPQPPRTEANYRIYGAESAQRLAFILHCRSLDMSLDEVRVLLRFRDSPADDCGDVNALLDEHISHVGERIRTLRQLEKQLRLLRERCAESSDAAHCGILGELWNATGADALAGNSPAANHTAGAHARSATSKGHWPRTLARNPSAGSATTNSPPLPARRRGTTARRP